MTYCISAHNVRDVTKADLLDRCNCGYEFAGVDWANRAVMLSLED